MRRFSGTPEFRELMEDFSLGIARSKTEEAKMAALEVVHAKITSLIKQKESRQARGEQEEERDQAVRATRSVDRGPVSGNGELWAVTPGATRNGQRATKDETLSVERSSLNAPEGGVPTQTAGVDSGEKRSEMRTGLTTMVRSVIAKLAGWLHSFWEWALGIYYLVLYRRQLREIRKEIVRFIAADDVAAGRDYRSSAISLLGYFVRYGLINAPDPGEREKILALLKDMPRFIGDQARVGFMSMRRFVSEAMKAFPEVSSRIVLYEFVGSFLKSDGIYGVNEIMDLSDALKGLGETRNEGMKKELMQILQEFTRNMEGTQDPEKAKEVAWGAVQKILLLTDQLKARKVRGEQEEERAQGATHNGQRDDSELWAVTPGATRNGQRATENETLSVARSSSRAPQGGVRSEVRNVARETAEVLLGAGANNRELGVVAEKVQRSVLAITVDGFAKILRREALVVLRAVDPAKVPAGVQVSEKTAESAVKLFVKRLKANSLKGNITMGFNEEPGRNFIDALTQLRAGIGIAVFSKAMMRAMPANILKGFRATQTVNSFRSYKPSRAAENKAVPVLAPDLGAEDLSANAAIFRVGVETGGIDGEPFLEVVENVVRIASGLLMAERLKSPADLKNPAKMEEIRAELLKILFKLDAGSGVLSIQGRNVIVHRGLLRQFILQYQAQSAIRTAA